MRKIYNKELAKLAEQMAQPGAPKGYLQRQMAEGPRVLEKIEEIQPLILDIIEEAQLELVGKGLEWTSEGRFTLHLGLSSEKKWAKEDLTSKPGSRLNNILFALGQLKYVDFSEPAEEDPLYIMVYG